MDRTVLPDFVYGAVYFRKSNPPAEDCERDYAVAAEDGYTYFRHWFLWSVIETAPGQYDWTDYDRQLDLAAQHGQKTIIAETITTALLQGACGSDLLPAGWLGGDVPIKDTEGYRLKP